jgi:hypothetical protein
MHAVVLIPFLIADSLCGANASGKECTPQPALEVLTTIGLAIVAAAMLLVIYNRITHRWASSQEMAGAVLAPIARLIARLSIPAPSKDPRDYRTRGRRRDGGRGVTRRHPRRGLVDTDVDPRAAPHEDDS